MFSILIYFEKYILCILSSLHELFDSRSSIHPKQFWLPLTTTPNHKMKTTRPSSSSNGSSIKWYLCLWVVLLIFVAGISVLFLTLHPAASTDSNSHQLSVSNIVNKELTNILLATENNAGNHKNENTEISHKPKQREMQNEEDSNTELTPKKTLRNREITKLKPQDSTMSVVGPLFDAETIEKFHQIHFVHMPKCGGTTMTAVLRQILCTMDSVKNSDCCLNPGFCDWHAFRRCANIKGCINHFPQRYY